MEAWREIARLIKQFKVRMCVVDAQPNSAPAHDLAREFPGRVLTCYYKDGQRAEVVEAADVRRRASMARPGNLSSTDRVDITIDRTETLDRVANDLTAGRILLPGPASQPAVEEFMKHCENNVRQLVEDRNDVPVYRWQCVNGPNDYFHTLNYLRQAVEECNRAESRSPLIKAPVKIIGVPQKPPTSGGFYPYPSNSLSEAANLYINPRVPRRRRRKKNNGW
jgi:hypothetical protein